MHCKPIPGLDPGTADEAFDLALLDLLLIDRPGLWSLAELSRSMSSSSQAVDGNEPSTHETEDAIERLFAAGLIHRIGSFVFASRAADAAQRLAS
jgi:hypothetical protein